MSIAIVTGASSGIGREIALQLAREKGLELWLVARRADRLETLKHEIEALGGRARCVSLDLGGSTAVAELKSLVVASGAAPLWLVNNAGFGFTGRFLDESPESIRQMIDLNITTLTLLCREFAALMPAGGKIINVASSVAFAPMPLYTVYAATKAYVLHFSIALAEEFKSQRISVTAVCPGPVATEFFEVARQGGGQADNRIPSMVFENPQATAARALAAARSSQSVVTTGSLAKAFRVMTAVMPKTLFASLSSRIETP